MASEWDASSISAVVALVLAVFALLVAVAQALQQYLYTGQLIRLCDSVVFGPLPGQGRRIWQLSQFRFLVVYSIPQISLPADLWPGQSPHIKSYATGKDTLPDLDPIPIDLSSSISTSSDSSTDNTTIRRRRTSMTDCEAQSSDVDSESGDQSTRFQRFRTGRLFVGIRPSDWLSKIRSNMPFLKKERRAINPIDRSVGEASWVSFCRAINGSCGASVRYHSVTYDADRCPLDLITAPMQVSMRDIVVMGLTAGMKITDCSFTEKSISMQGAVGSITSSNHAILGPILHFTPRVFESVMPRSLAPNGKGGRGTIELRWLCRTWGVCYVARRAFNSLDRRTTRRLDDRQTSYQEGASDSASTKAGKRGFQQGGIVQVDLKKKKSEGKRKSVPRPRSTGVVAPLPQDGPWRLVTPYPTRVVQTDTGGNDHAPVVNAQRGAGEDEEVHVTPSHPPDPTIDPALSGGQPGQATTSMETVQGQQTGQESTTEEAPESNGVHIVGKTPDNAPELSPNRTNDSMQEGGPESNQGHDTQPVPVSIPTTQDEPRTFQPQRQATVEDAPDSGEEERASRAGTSLDPETHDRGLAAKMRQGARNKRGLEIQRDKAVVGVNPNLLRLEWHPQDESGSRPSRSAPKKEEERAREREAERQQRRAERERERDRRNRSRRNALSLGQMDMYWFCQMDICQGFWATPWESAAPAETSLVGAITVILEALLGFLEEGASLIYREPSLFHETQGWMSEGGASYPAYASNARGGVIAKGTYEGVRVRAFQCRIPALELLYSYDWQVSSSLHDQERYCKEQNIELMRIDAWLSYVGRTDEISRGPKDLLKGTPPLVQLLQAEFEVDFTNIDLSAKEGGQQDIQGLADNVMDFLTDEELNEAEQLYILVALLRAVKVCQCILAGSSTDEINEILLKDVQAHLV
ncbi:hypothetical protein BHE90_001851 [Fusarium euwallaceae]|uniref:Uncharacterized protein n=1 Tax=Fusarium euwallaceae TaxID=1147111 RepID=A0A430M6K5_9HYPO|nr:hypothetical protein BHE90_001851 [Fusarium euwallaceae]